MDTTNRPAGPVDHNDAIRFDPKGPYARGSGAGRSQSNPYPQELRWAHEEWAEGYDSYDSI